MKLTDPLNSPIRKPTAMSKAAKYWKCDGLVNKKLVKLFINPH